MECSGSCIVIGCGLKRSIVLNALCNHQVKLAALMLFIQVKVKFMLHIYITLLLLEFFPDTHELHLRQY